MKLKKEFVSLLSGFTAAVLCAISIVISKSNPWTLSLSSENWAIYHSVFFYISILSLITLTLSLVAVISGIAMLERKTKDKTSQGWMAVVGIILGVISALIAVLSVGILLISSPKGF